MAIGTKKIKFEKIKPFGEYLTGQARRVAFFQNLTDFLTQRNYSVCMLKVKKCDADYCRNFRRAFCAFARSSDGDCEIFGIADLFQKGVTLLQDYVMGNQGLPLDAGETALTTLMSFLENQTDAASKIQNAVSEELKEAELTAVLVHHLLYPLSVNRGYILNASDKRGIENGRCPCGCNESLKGSFGDTSMGMQQYWHGSVDVLMGDVSIEVLNEKNDENDETSSSVENKQEFGENSLSQIIAETIVFGCLRYKFETLMDNFLIPTIVATKEFVKILFFDAEHDILLESGPLILLDDESQIPDCTIIALWLAINYRFLGTGVTTGMLAKKWTADFLTSDYSFYKEGVVLGNCSRKTKEDTFQPGRVSRYVRKKYKAYMPVAQQTEEDR